MKIKPTKKPGGVVVELAPDEAEFPGTPPETKMPFKLKRILVPIDFSKCSKKALTYALPFAKQFEATVVLLYVVEPYLPGVEMTAVDIDLIQARSRESGEQELAKLRDEIGLDTAVESVVRVGNPVAEIAQAAKDLDIDLIIATTHGRTGLAHVFLGSTAERTVRYAPCPVLIVREREHEFVETTAEESSSRVGGGIRADTPTNRRTHP